MFTEGLFDKLAEALSVHHTDRRAFKKRLDYRRRLSPSLSYGRHFGPPLPSSKPAAVLINIEQRDFPGVGPCWCFPLTVRDRNLPDHPGQISLPGGRVEAAENGQQAAEREFCEELCVGEFHGRQLGQLSQIYVYNSGYLVQAFVSHGAAKDYSPEPGEVERILFMPLDTLYKMQVTTRTFQHQRTAWTAPGFAIGDDFIWGATAIVLAELAAVLDDTLDN